MKGKGPCLASELLWQQFMARRFKDHLAGSMRPGTPPGDKSVGSKKHSEALPPHCFVRRTQEEEPASVLPDDHTRDQAAKPIAEEHSVASVARVADNLRTRQRHGFLKT